MSTLTPFPGTSRPRPAPRDPDTDRKSVSIVHGTKWAVHFGSGRPALQVGPDLAREISARMDSGEPSAPSPAPKGVVPHPNLTAQRTATQTRARLIALLDLTPATIARLDHNARMLGVDFATALAGELNLDGDPAA